jgi:hypothetical protein
MPSGRSAIVTGAPKAPDSIAALTGFSSDPPSPSGLIEPAVDCVVLGLGVATWVRAPVGVPESQRPA